jgi:hypothetical protein
MALNHPSLVFDTIVVNNLFIPVKISVESFF